MAALKKPAYSMSRQAFWVSFVLAWIVILALIWGALAGRDGAVQIAPVAIPAMVMMVAALLGIHRAFGSMDMRSIAAASAPPIDTNYPPDARFGASVE